MVFGFGRNPDKLEQRALAYEQRGKTAKAIKCREKAARLRAGTLTPIAPTGYTTTGLAGPTTGFATTGLAPTTGLAGPGLATTGLAGSGLASYRTPQRYEQNALKWEQRGNWTKAQKNREKVWRLQNPQYGAQYAAPQFYQNNRFLGYNVPYAGTPSLQKGALSQTLPAVVETHVRPTIVQQTTRAEKIVEVQPVVHREISAPQVHVIEKHLYETVPSTGPNVITNRPIIEETVKPRIIEEIQPVVHREVPAPFVERVEQHVTERITQPTTMTKEVINDATVRPVGIAAGGIPLQQQVPLQQQGPLQGVKNAINNATNRPL